MCSSFYSFHDKWVCYTNELIFFPLFSVCLSLCFILPIFHFTSPPFLHDFPHDLLLFPPCLPSCVPFLLVLEMDMGMPGEGDSSINALCSQINTSFTKPSEELFSNPSLSANGPQTCTVPPVLPPPPAPMQGKEK